MWGKPSGRSPRTVLSRLFWLLIVIQGTAEAQALRLEISVPKTKIKASEPVNLTIKIVNVSTKPYYVSGDIALGAMGAGHEFGSFQLQVRKPVASDFVNVGGFAADAFGRRTRSTNDIIVENQLVLLESNEYSRMFIGRTINSNWPDLTLLEPGRYSIRVKFNTYGDRTVVPKDIRYPIFLQSLVSNVLDLEIQP